MASVRRIHNTAGSITRRLRVKPPFRLDLTGTALRRTPTNLVDLYTPDGHYLRALGGFARPVVVSVRQIRRDVLEVSVKGRASHAEWAVANVRRILGTERDVSNFHRRARDITWLAPLAGRMRGLRPPRYPSLFEACANSILFQQVSLLAASAIMRRMLLALGATAEYDGIPLVVFPSAAQFLDARTAVLRRAGVSTNKIATLRSAAEAIESGALSEEQLEQCSSEEAALLLREIKGIGPWTAGLILLRGLGRLDVFPVNDSGVARNLPLVAGRRVDVARVAEQLGPQRGMLYFCVLLSRAEGGGWSVEG